MVSAERDQRNYKMKENFSKDVGQSGNFSSFPLSPWQRRNNLVFFTGLSHPTLGWLPPNTEMSPPTLLNSPTEHLKCILAISDQDTYKCCAGLLPDTTQDICSFSSRSMFEHDAIKYLLICLEPLEDFAGFSFSSSLLLANSSAERCWKDLFF